jgi:hypothetical protein
MLVKRKKSGSPHGQGKPLITLYSVSEHDKMTDLSALLCFALLCFALLCFA